MTGTLSQLITLTTYGNDYLINGHLPTNFYPAHKTFQFCNKVDFREFKKRFFFSKSKETIITDNPSEWFSYLKSHGCKKLRLYFEYSKDQSLAKDHKLAGMVGGGGLWLMEAVYDAYSNYWQDRWEVTRKTDPGNNIWTVNYGMIVKKLPTSNLQIEQANVKEALKQTLIEIIDFARKQNLEDWVKVFDKANAILESDTPHEYYYDEKLIPINNYSLTAKQILFSAGSAWVFGGMGSWNDLGFDGKEENDLYENLSKRLYSTINQAIISATNSY